MRNTITAALCALLLQLAGCASMSDQECLATDWYERGLRDGREGYPASRINSYREACARVQVQPDHQAWERGREIGLLEYCDLGLALERGLQRRGQERVCDLDSERLYRAARALGDARYQIEAIDHELGRLERELLSNRKLTDEQRRELALQIRNLERQRDRARDDRLDAERQLDRVRNDLGV